MKKEIDQKTKENEELEVRARQLQNNVEQRKQITQLRSKGDEENSQDPQKKFKQIAAKRHLLDLLEQQTEEIQFLRDELDRHRAKTFPSFAHVNQKKEFPDEV